MDGMRLMDKMRCIDSWMRRKNGRMDRIDRWMRWVDEIDEYDEMD